MEALIQVFRMTEISVETRCRIMVALGSAINDQLGGNYSEPLVYELVMQLDPLHPELSGLAKRMPKWWVKPSAEVKF